VTETVDSLIIEWGKALANSGQSKLTCSRYESAVRAFVAWFATQNNEPFNPSRLTPIDLSGYRNALQQNAAASTVNVHLCALRSFCVWLVEHGKIATNPCLRLKAVGMQAPLAPKALTAPQVNALLREAQWTRHALRDYAIMQVLVQTGIRISECVALRLADVQMSERQGQITVRAGKGNKVRVVPLNASARRALLEYLAARWSVAAEWKSVLTAWTSQPVTTPLWRSQKGNRLSVRAMSGVVEQLVELCVRRKLVPEDTSAHTLRHTFATNYLKDYPGDLVGLAALLGHSSLETTRIYVQPSADDLAQRVESTRLNAYS
jgi:site-specific recombinase XerD